MNTDLNSFVKSRLEEGEGISPEALAQLLSAAQEANPVKGRELRVLFGLRARSAFLLAASLTLACCGWLVHNHRVTQREADLTNVIALLQTAEGSSVGEAASLTDSLLAWQDAPCVEILN